MPPSDSTTSRRHFLALLGTAGLLGCGRRVAMVAPPANAASSAPTPPQPRHREAEVLILGAGVAGLAAQDAAALSLAHYDDTEEFGGGDVVLPGGYDALLAPLRDGLDVRLGVEAVEVSVAPGGVEVRDRAGGSWRGACVVVTLPLGVLQAGKVRLQPPLPAVQQRAIQRLGMGVLDKVVLVWEPAALAGLAWPKEHVLGRVTAPAHDPWVEWLNLRALTGAPALMGFVAGAAARAVEALPDAELQAVALRAARSMLGQRLPAPKQLLRTRWAADPFSLGSYSSVGVDASPRDCSALAEPASARLFLAGEHTDADYQGTVHGALRSGRRAAAQVVDALSP